jgi:Mg2+ and Co2+ transporter CorA
MNFTNIPEYHAKHGYLFAILFTVASTLATFVYFKRKGWL